MSDVLVRASIAVSADTSAFDKAMEALPNSARKQIKKSVDAINTEMAQVGKGISQATNFADVKKLTDYYAQLKKSLDTVKMSAISQAQSLNPANKALNDAGKAAGNSAYKMQLFAQTIDDLQYVPEQGLRPILNNLSQFAPQLALVGIAVDQLIRHWDDLSKAFTGTSLKTAAQELDDLRQKANLTANEFDRLARADALKGKVTEFRGAKTAGQQQEESAATTAITNAGAKDVVAGIRKVAPEMIDRQGEAAVVLDKIQKQEKRLTILQGMVATDTTGQVFQDIDRAEKEIKRLKLEDLENARNRTAEDKVAQAAIVKDLGGRRKDLIDLINKNPAAFGGGDKEKGLALAEQLRRADPATNRLANIGEILKNGIANAFQVEIPNKAKDAQQKLTADEKAAGVQAAGGLGGRLNPQLLKDVALGNTTNRELLATAIEGGMKRAGFKDPKQFSGEAANNLISNNEEAIRKRVLEAGGTREQAAQYLLAQNVDRIHAEANKNRPSLGVTDIESYHREAQDSFLKGGETKALIEEQERLIKAHAEAKASLDDLTRTIKEKGNKAVLQ